MSFEKKQPNKSLKLESISTDEVYSITLNPADARQTCKMITSNMNDVQIMKAFHAQLNGEIQDIKKYIRNAELELYPELSPNGRLHFHGYIKIKHPILFIYRDMLFLTRNYGNYYIDTIGQELESKQKYHDYVTKQSKIICQAMDDEYRYPIFINCKEPLSK